jgi:hypothetical protein
VDPQRSISGLRGSFPGTEVDVTGAGDHLDKVDSKIRRIKETMRSVIAGLAFSLPKRLVKDLVTYVVSRINTRRTTALNDNVYPRVKFTGRKVDYKMEYCLAFGDYVEAYDPRAEKKSNDAMTNRTEPCIVLYPSGNLNGSWIFWNMNTSAYVRRTQWRKMVVNEVVISRMNALAGLGAGLTTAYFLEAEPTENGADEAESSLAVHTPLDEPVVISMMHEEAALEEEIELPQDNDDSSQDRGAGTTAVVEAEAVVEHESDRPRQSTAGIITRDEEYEWNFMNVANISVKAGLRDRGQVAVKACHDELEQMFFGKKVLVPLMPWELYK